MSFKHPVLLLLALLVCVAFACVYLFAQRRRSVRMLKYSNLAFLIAAAQPPAWAVRALAAAWIAGVALVALAVAGPRVRTAVPVRDGTVVLCVDTSGSMAATDVQPTRAQAALDAMRAFIAGVPSGVAIGLVSFAGDAQVVTPPSRDRDTVVAALQNIPAPNGATAIGDALLLALRSMPKHGKRVIVLITDGESNFGTDPAAAAQQLAAARVKLYTVGIGTNNGALVPGTLQEAGINEDALRSYARTTGGTYSRAGDAAQLRGALAALGRTTSFEPALVDLSLPGAVLGALIMAIAFLCGVWTKST